MSDQTNNCQHVLGVHSLDDDVYLITDNGEFEQLEEEGSEYEVFDFCPKCGMCLSDYAIPM